jgi:hypothetical protein
LNDLSFHLLCLQHGEVLAPNGPRAARLNRDREGPRGLPPPTPPDIRVTSPAVRWIESGSHTHPNRSVGSRRASGPCIPGVEPSGPRLAGCHRPTPAETTTPFYRSGLPSTSPGTMPSADFCRAVREDYSPLSPAYWDNRPISQGKTQNVPRIGAGFIKHTPCGWRTSRSRARSSRVCHTSYPVPVRRPARLDWASSRPHLAADALALLLAFGSANTWREDLHLARSVPCLAHTLALSRARKPQRSGGFWASAPVRCSARIPHFPCFGFPMLSCPPCSQVGSETLTIQRVRSHAGVG